jgi:RNA polymerase sigma-70 factor, ECF subfamily
MSRRTSIHAPRAHPAEHGKPGGFIFLSPIQSPTADVALSVNRAQSEQLASPTETEDLTSLLTRVGLFRDQAAFARLYTLTRRDLFAVAFRILRSRHTAEEALQDAFVNIWNSAGDFRPSISQAKTWLVSIVRHRALDVLRSEHKHPRRTSEIALLDADEMAVRVAADELSPPDLLARAIDTLAIRRCMDALDPAHRQTLALAYYRGMSHSEIAAQMRAPIGTVKSWMRRAVERLRDCLEAAGRG